MSVTTTNIYSGFFTSGTELSIGFDFNVNSQIAVYERDESVSPAVVTQLSLGAAANEFQLRDINDNFVTSDSDPKAVEVLLGTAASATRKILVVRETTLTQEHDYLEGDKYYADNNEYVADKAMQGIQEVEYGLDRCLRLEQTYSPSGVIPILPDPVGNQYLKWNAGGTAIEYSAGTGTPGTDGSTVLNGSGAPADTLGANGDFYINTDNYEIWGPKSDGTWAGTNVALRGNSILNGNAPPNAGDGVDGDYWINNNALTLYGPKAGGAWPASGQDLRGKTALLQAEFKLFGPSISAPVTNIDGYHFADTSKSLNKIRVFIVNPGAAGNFKLDLLQDEAILETVTLTVTNGGDDEAFEKSLASSHAFTAGERLSVDLSDITGITSLDELYVSCFFS